MNRTERLFALRNEQLVAYLHTLYPPPDMVFDNFEDSDIREAAGEELPPPLWQRSLRPSDLEIIDLEEHRPDSLVQSPRSPRSRQPDRPVPWGEDVRSYEVTTYGYEAYSPRFYDRPTEEEWDEVMERESQGEYFDDE